MSYNFPSTHLGQDLVHAERKRFNYLFAGRRWRKTTYMSMFMFRKARKHKGEYLWASPTHDQNKIALSYMEKMGKEHVKVNRSSMTLTMENGSLIRFRSLVKPDNARGFTIDGVCIDEAAYTPQEAFFDVIRPTLMSSLGWAFLGSTPNGYNWLYDLWVKGNNDYTATWRIPSFGVALHNNELRRIENKYENPHLSFDEVINLYDQMPSFSFRQEILCEFIANQLNPFVNIDELCILPNQSSSQIETIAGIDFAKTTDYTCLSVFDRSTSKEVAMIRLPQIDYTMQIELIKNYVEKFKVRNICFDSTGVGVKLAEDMYSAFAGRVGLYPFTFTSDSKAKIIMDLILAMEKKRIWFTNDREGIAEFRKFGRIQKQNSVSFEAITGHDDSVCARALAFNVIKRSGLFT